MNTTTAPSTSPEGRARVAAAMRRVAEASSLRTVLSKRDHEVAEASFKATLREHPELRP